MHELSLVEGIMDTVRETAEARGGRVTSFRVRVGELAQFDIRIVRELIAELKKGTPMKDTKVVVELERSKVVCLSCNSEWTFDKLIGPMSRNEKEMVHFLPELLSSYSKCPSCSGSFFEIREGRSVRVSEVVLDV